jgi:hypothetical protein
VPTVMARLIWLKSFWAESFWLFSVFLRLLVMGVCFTSLDTDKEESDMLVGWSRLGDRLPGLLHSARDVFVEKKVRQYGVQKVLIRHYST